MPRVAFIVSEFPRPVDAYFLRELVALDRRGIDFCIYSLRRPRRASTPRGATSLLGRTRYAPPLHAWAMRAAHVELVRRGWRQYGSALRDAVLGHAPSPRLLAKVLGVWPQTIYFAARARQDGVRHLHANWATYPAAAAATIARLLDLEWSFAGHASDIYLHPTNLAAKMRGAKFVVTCTEESRRYLLGLASDVDPARVHAVHHGIDLAALRRDPVPQPDLHLLAVGTLRDCKGFDTLIRAVARLAADGLPVRLTVVGDGEERRDLEALARELGCAGRVVFTGYVPHEDVAAFYAQATLLVHPARLANHFGIPNVIVEAQAARLPVVSSRLPALAELIDEDASGVYVPEDDVDELCAVLGSLLADPERRRRLAEEGARRVAERFDLERTAARLARLFGAEGEPAARREAVA
jgi:glycosyltransferase involved in cell wall biosynthesis